MKRPRRISKDDMKKGIYILPSLFTTASMLFGFFAILSVMQGKFEIAAISILISAVLDGLDGRIARVTKTVSKFGAEYDSLADVIAFGVAPAIMIYKWSLEPYGNWGVAVAFLLLVCGALRLARFNVQIDIIDSKYFNGLPIPLPAAALATGVLFFYKLGFVGQLFHPSMLVVIVFLSLLMVSSVKFYSFKDMNFFARKPLMSFTLIVITLAVIISEPHVTLFVFCCGYIVSGPILLGTKLIKTHLLKHADADEHGHAKNGWGDGTL
ncbi:MAG: CDP-diacylglycerol--serine O-phosphatidyltransferase [Deltaproteobacteria bacterium]